jgi:hypothetical protein
MIEFVTESYHFNISSQKINQVFLSEARSLKL